MTTRRSLLIMPHQLPSKRTWFQPVQYPFRPLLAGIFFSETSATFSRPTLEISRGDIFLVLLSATTNATPLPDTPRSLPCDSQNGQSSKYLTRQILNRSSFHKIVLSLLRALKLLKRCLELCFLLRL